MLGSVPSGLPSIGLPSGVGWSEVVPLLATSASMVLVILAQSAATSRAYAIKYQDRFVENNDLVGLSVANVAAGLSGTFPVNGSPTKTEMADEAHSKTQVAMLTMAVTVGIVLLFLTKPLQYMPNAVLSAVVFLIGVKLVKIGGMNEIRRLRMDEFVIASVTAVVVVVVGVEQGIILAIVLSLLDHVRRHYDAPDAVITRDEQGHVDRDPGVARRSNRARARRVPVRRRPLLRQLDAVHRGGARARRRPRAPSVVRRDGRCDGRRGLHRRQDTARTRREARQSERRVLRRRRAAR